MPTNDDANLPFLFTNIRSVVLWPPLAMLPFLLG